MDRPRTDKTSENDALLAEDQQGRSSIVEDATELSADRQRVSNRTNIHDTGSDANDTADGLTEAEEAVRHAAEYIPTGQDPAGPTEATPVFDRGSLPPKI